VDAKKAMREYSALDIGTDLTFYEAGNGRALPSRSSQEGFELFANDFVEKGLFGFVAFVLDGGLNGDKESTGTDG
jgi:hypothetical protein